MKLFSVLSEDGLRGRAIRSSILTVIDTGSQNALRLAGNLVLTRLLFPEAFGIMALVTVVMTGLRMFSEIGVRLSIVQNKRGDDPEFLNTAWVLQIARGILLWLATCLAAAPAAAFYEAPILAQLLPVAGLVAVFQGFTSTKLATANRNLLMGQVTVLSLGSRVFGLAVLIGLAWWWESVWALVVGSLVAPFVIMILSHLALPGPGNRFRFERSAARDLIQFGKFIFLSTIAGFLISQADRAILGKFVSLSELAFYNIAIMFATLPRMIQQQLTDRVLFPLYSKKSPAENAENYANIARARLLVLGGAFSALAVLAVIGQGLITLLYDARYESAGSLLVVMAIAAMPGLIAGTYGTMIVARGDSGRYAALLIVSALMRTAVLFVAIYYFGVVGAAMAPLVASVLVYPAIVWFIWPYKGWVPLQDLWFSLLGVVAACLAIWVNADALRQLFGG